MSALSCYFCYAGILIAVSAFSNAGATPYSPPVNQNFQKIADSIQDLAKAFSTCQSSEPVLKVAEVLRSQQTTLSEIKSSTAHKPPPHSQFMSYDLMFQLGGFKQKFDEISPRFEEADEKLNIFEERLLQVQRTSSQSREKCDNNKDEIEKLVQRVEATIETDNETMTQIEERLLELETNSSQAREESRVREEEIQDLVQKVEAISIVFEGADERTKELEERLLQVEKTSSQAKEDLQNNEDKIQDLVQKVEATNMADNETMTQIEERLLELETNSSQASEESRVKEEEIQDLVQKVEAISIGAKKELQNNEDKIQDLLQKMEAISKRAEERTKEVEERLLQVENSSSQAKKESQSNEDKIQDLVQKVEAISKSLCLPPFYQVGQDCIYIDLKVKRTWSDCRTFCKTFGGDLVVPSDVIKLRDYLATVNKDVNYWIGASDIKKEGVWTWLNGRTVDLSVGWGKGEPNEQGGEDCCHYAEGLDLGLNDRPCSNALYCICQDASYPT